MSPLILFVEDDEALRESASTVMRMEGYNVLVASDGEDALDVLEKEPGVPDLIVSDIAMPRMDGFEFFKRVRQMPRLRGVPFIFLTALGTRQDVLMGRKLGADDYLVKPFDPEDFLAAVENKLKRVKELRESAESRLNDARRSLVQLLSHELRTPLTYVSGGQALMAETLEDEDDVSIAALKDNLSLIASGTERLIRLADQMVTYSELQSGHAAVQLREAGEVLDLVDVATSTVNELQASEMWNFVDFAVFAPESGILKVFGVYDLLLGALGEVLRNAAHFSAAGDPVTVRLWRDGDEAVIEVADRGSGIKEDDLPRVWEPMVQSDRSIHEQQGLGLGLAITKGVIELHGGSAHIASKVNEGTTVTLRLPLAQGGS